jgi:hypothetical protein
VDKNPEIEFAMPGKLKLYRDYELTDESEVASAAGKTDANLETKQRNKYALNPKNKDGYDSKWNHAGKKSTNKLVDDGTGKGTMVRAGVKWANKQALIRVDDGSGNGTMVRPCHKQASCVTCKVALRQKGSDKCNPCALAVMAAFFGT